MRSRTRIRRVLALALALLLLASAGARADRATFDRVSDAYANNAGQLDPCTFSQADLESALEGIPREFEGVVPQLREAIERGVAAHRSGDCRGIAPTGGVTTTPAGTPTTPTTPTTTTPGTDTSAVPPPVTTTPSATPPVAAPQQVTTTPGVQQPATKRDSRALVLGAIALGALALLALLAWAWARLRGWDPLWATRARHAWGEAGYRVATTWAEFTDWLRLGR
jgi:hypothetical protein